MNPEFADRLQTRIREMAKAYPRKEAALLPALHFLEQELGFISPDAERLAAEALEIPPVRVREAVSFYTMFSRRPRGKYLLEVCDNLSCRLAGQKTILEFLEQKLGVRPGETTSDSRFTLTTVECQGSCDRAPCIRIGGEFHERMDRQQINEILDSLK